MTDEKIDTIWKTLSKEQKDNLLIYFKVDKLLKSTFKKYIISDYIQYCYK